MLACWYAGHVVAGVRRGEKNALLLAGGPGDLVK